MLRILTYHRIASPDDYPFLNPRLVSASPRVFEAQMDYVARHYSVISADQLVAAIVHGLSLPRRSVLLTFDDASVDFAEFAWPVLRRFGLPSTLFVPTAYPDHPARSFWWDRLYRIIRNTSCNHCGSLPLDSPADRNRTRDSLQDTMRTLPRPELNAMLDMIASQCGEDPAQHKSVLGWNELRQLSGSGVTVAPHTRTHTTVTGLSLAELRDEILGSFDDVRNEIGSVPPLFSYPYGTWSDAAEAVLKETRCVAAFTMKWGNQLGEGSSLRLQRTNVARHWGFRYFTVRLSSIGGHFERWRGRRLSSPTLEN